MVVGELCAYVVGDDGGGIGFVWEMNIVASKGIYSSRRINEDPEKVHSENDHSGSKRIPFDLAT